MLNLRLDMIKSCEIPISDGYTEYSSLFSTKPSDQKLDDDLKKIQKILTFAGCNHGFRLRLPLKNLCSDPRKCPILPPHKSI